MLWTYLQERLNEIDENPATVCFCLNGREDKEEGKKLHSLKGDDGVYMAKELPKQKKKNLNTSLKTLSKMALQTMEIRGRIVCKFLLFFVLFLIYAPQRGDLWRNYLYIHSLLFQSMINTRQSLKRGGVDFVLLSLSTSLHPSPPFHVLPQLLDSHVPYPSAGFGQRATKQVPRAGLNPLVDIVPLFIFQ